MLLAYAGSVMIAGGLSSYFLEARSFVFDSSSAHFARIAALVVVSHQAEKRSLLETVEAAQSEMIEHVVATIREACLPHLIDPEAMARYARSKLWHKVPDGQIRQHSSDTRVLLGAWRYLRGSGSFLVLHTKEPANSRFSCSITTDAESRDQYLGLKMRFEREFTVKTYKQDESAGMLIGRYKLTAPFSDEVEASVSYQMEPRALMVRIYTRGNRNPI